MANPAHQNISQQDAHALASGYSRSIRALEISGITLWTLAAAFVVYRLAGPAANHPWVTVLAVVAGYFAADFVSGFVHWAADTWGSTEMPVLGKAFIRPFREHHVDAKAITRHDFVETNGNNCIVSIPVAILALFPPFAAGSAGAVFWMAFLLSLMVWVFGTNQFHKWAHQDVPALPVRVLQKLHLVLPRDHHDVHHTAPFHKNYCITVGLMNYPLQAIGFFRLLEWGVTSATGALPRRDDIGEAAAKSMAAAHPVPSPEGLLPEALRAEVLKPAPEAVPERA